MGPDWYLLQQQEQQHLPEELDRWDLTGTYSCNRNSTTSLRTGQGWGPDWYLLLQQEQHNLPEKLDRWDLTATYSSNRSSNTSLRSWTGGA